MRRFTVFPLIIILLLINTNLHAGNYDASAPAKNALRLYGGIGYWGLYSEYSGPAAGGGVSFGQKYRATAVYGFSYQRDLVRRLSLELDVQNSYRNTFPDIADAPAVTTTDNPGGYEGLADMPSVRDYIDRWIAAGNDPNNLTWLRHNSLAISVRPVFHIIDTGHHRFSAYAGIGWYFADGLCFETAALFPEIEPENYTASTWQYHVSGLSTTAVPLGRMTAPCSLPRMLVHCCT